MEKVANLAGAIGIVLAIVAGVVAIPGLNMPLVLLILGIVAGISASQDGAIRAYVAVLALPAIGAALGAIPAVGEHLTAIFGNLAVAVAGISASLAARRLYEMVMGAVKGFAAS